jgi:threonine/homoserine/homoserine lactone efflux protein
MIDAVFSLIIATALLFGSPGPATLGLAATGATVGFKKGLGFLAGVLLGLLVATIGAAVGIVSLFSAFPNIALSLQIIGSIYILYIAYKIASAPVLKSENLNAIKAPNFSDGFILNLLNPKAYAAFFAIFSQFLLPYQNNLTSLFMTALVCLIVTCVVDVIWLYLGGMLRGVFEQEKPARIMRASFAVAMILAVVYVFIK